MTALNLGHLLGVTLCIDSYVIDETVIGRGSYGVVAEAVHKSNLTTYAVKMVEKRRGTTQDLVDFKIEADILRSMNHPNIVCFHNFLEEATKYYLFTELIRGGELFDRMIEKNGFSEVEVQKITRKLILAVDYCHRHGIVHRDIKAENVLFVSKYDDSDLRLIDFGFAARTSGITLKGELGTPDYMAPEIWGGHQLYGAPVDMWACGVLVYMILVSYPPFLHHTPMGIKNKIIQGIYEFHPEHWERISDDAKDFVSRLLTVDMTTRMTAEQALQHPWMRSDRKRLLSGLPLASAVRHENDTSVQDGKTLLSNASPICRMSTASNASAMTDTESLCDSLSRTSLSILSSHSSEGECYFDASQILLELGKVDENENENDV